MIAMTRAAYGSANSPTNSQRSGSAKPSISSLASAWKRGDQAADQLRREGGVHQPAQPVVLLALLVEDPAGEPVGERPFGDAVVRGPGDAALPQLGVLEQPVDLLVAQHGDAVRRGRVPAALAGVVDLGGGDRERRVSDVEGGNGVERRADDIECYLQECVDGWSLNTLKIECYLSSEAGLR